MRSNSQGECIRKVTKYASDSDDDGGAVLKSQYFITMQYGKVVNGWTDTGSQETVITNQAIQSEKQTTRNRTNLRPSWDITAYQSAKKRGIDEEALGEADTTSIEINRVQKKTMRHKRRKKESRPISTTGIRLSDHVLSEIAAEQSPWTLARFGRLSQKTLILCKREMRRRLNHKIVDVQYYLSDGETYIHRGHCECSEYIERICSLMEFILACDVKITGFRDFPPILWNIAVPIPYQITRHFEEAFSHCFTHLPIGHLESISPRVLSTTIILKIATLSSSRIASVDLIINDQTQMRELAFISRLKNIDDLTLKMRSPCPVFACKHGRGSEMPLEDDDEENSLWPKTLRFVSLQKMHRFRIIIFDYVENDLWRCSYLRDEFSLRIARSSGNKQCSMLSLMPSLVSLSLPCAPPKLMRRACACDSKLRQLVIGTYYRDRDTVMRPAETTIVDDVLAMFFNVRHWKSFDPKKIYLEEIKLIMDCIRFPNRVFAIADLEILLEMIYETCHRLRRLDIVLSLPSFIAPLASPTQRGMCRSLITHFTLRVPWMDGGYLNFAAAASTCLKVLPDTVESIGISVRTESVNCVTSFLTIISSLENISRFSCLDAVHFQIDGLPCFELLLMQVSHSLETISEVSILSSPLCLHKNELLSNLKVFVGRMRNLSVLRVNEEFARLIFNGKAVRRSDLRELCTEIGYKGVISIGAAPDLEEWNSSVSSILPDTLDKDRLLHLFSVYMEMTELHPDIPWKVPNFAAYSLTEETIKNFPRQSISESHIDESSSEEEESSEDTAGFITEDVQYDTEIDELEEAELQLANDGSVDDDFDEDSDELDEAEEEEDSESNGSPREEVGDEEYEDHEELEEEEESYSHNSFIDDEAEEEQEEVDEHESDQGSLDNSDSNEEGVSGDEFDESVLESSSDDDLELADLVMNPQRRVMRKKIIISESDGDS